MRDMRKVLSIIVLGTWSAGILLIFILIIFNLIDVEIGKELLKTFSSISSGFVGVVFGYYFTSRRDDI
uniref:Uncharacterized protein n=1 Tax=Candidatus Kentrum sp. LFY TaxID=2126342 RepID=A0A450WUZ3_9GAMM|nr:MAG: hypothetical protein BECKLFY1418C_GA0070996_108011 [Candidatus Kentron sp. LFY]